MKQASLHRDKALFRPVPAPSTDRPFCREQEYSARQGVELEDIAQLRRQAIEALAHVARRQ